MKEKIIVAIMAVIVLMGAIFTAKIIYEREEKNIEEPKEELIISEKILDECTQEYEQSKNENIDIRQVSSSDEKVLASSAMLLKKYYKKCNHTINEYLEIPPELVNMTEEEVSNNFEGWELIGFEPNEITLYKEFDEECNEHFKLKDENGNIAIYKILENGKEELYEETGISTEYLTETDLLKMKDANGFLVYTKEELNKLLEDFE